MPPTHPRELQIYQHPNGREPFTEWLESRGQKMQERIQARLDRLVGGNFGEADNTIVLLLCGGDKSSQNRDIACAKAYWLEYKESQQ